MLGFRPTLIDLSKPVSRKRAAPEADSRPLSSETIKRLKDEDGKRSQSPALAEPIDSEEEDEIQELTENGEYDFAFALVNSRDLLTVTYVSCRRSSLPYLYGAYAHLVYPDARRKRLSTAAQDHQSQRWRRERQSKGRLEKSFLWANS